MAGCVLKDARSKAALYQTSGHPRASRFPACRLTSPSIARPTGRSFAGDISACAGLLLVLSRCKHHSSTPSNHPSAVSRVRLAVSHRPMEPRFDLVLTSMPSRFYVRTDFLAAFAPSVYASLCVPIAPVAPHTSCSSTSSAVQWPRGARARCHGSARPQGPSASKTRLLPRRGELGYVVGAQDRAPSVPR